MSRFVFILLTMVLLARYSVSSTPDVHLIAIQKNGQKNTKIALNLDLNRPFTINIYSKTLLYGLLCKDSQKSIKMFFKVKLKKLHNVENVYTFKNKIVATEAMNSTWKCTLSYSSDDIDGTEFQLKIKVRDISTNSEVETVSDSDGFSTTHKSYYDKTTSNKTIYPTNLYQNTENNDGAENDTTKGKEREIHNTIPDNTTAPEQHANNIKHVSNTSTLVVIISVVITPAVIVVGVIAVTVSRKICRQKTSVGETGARPGSRASDTVYEELDLVAYKAESTEDIANRPPLPLPFEEREENKYIHYDTPYDHRFTRRVLAPSQRHHSAHALKRL